MLRRMRTLIGSAVRSLVLLATLAPAVPLAQVEVRIQVGLPAVLPPLVVVQPGIQVVQGLDEEVFYVNGYYWVRRGGYWYRTRDHRGTWVYVEPRRVPPGLVRIPPGQYRRWWKEERREEKRAGKERERGERREWKEEKRREKEGRRGDRDRDRD
jgi:hypothetical protein